MTLRIRIERRRPTRPPWSVTRRGLRPVSALTALVAITAGALVVGPPASATTPAGGAVASGTVSVLVRSVTVSPTGFAFTCDGPGGALELPNGHCTSDTLTVTNGAADSQIFLMTSSFTPADHGRRWSVCGAAGDRACHGSGVGLAGLTNPGNNQFSLVYGPTLGLALGSHASCDANFWSGSIGTCLDSHVLPHASEPETFTLVGPTTSSDRSPTFSVHLTWTALP